MRLITLLTLLISMTGAALAAEAPADLAAIEGVYKHRFQNGTVQGDKYVSENILEIVPTGPDQAYFRTHLEYFNGHVCDLYGIADWRDGALHFEDTPIRDYPACRLRMEVKGGDIIFVDDKDVPCRNDYCGARGSFGVDFKAGEKRRIRYMERLLQSKEYVAAKEAYEARRKE